MTADPDAARTPAPSVAKSAAQPTYSSEIAYSVVVLTFARDPALVVTLQTLAAAMGARRDVEIILVDNNTDGVDRTPLLARFPHHRLVRTGANKGVSGRNNGMDVARGDILVLLDDDVLVQTTDFLDIFKAGFDAHPDVGVINVRKLDGQTLSVLPECVPHTRKSLDLDQPFFTFRFIGGLVALRRTLHTTLGGYSADLFYGEEEREYSYRILKAGWRLYYEPQITAVETNNSGGRRSRRSLRTEILANRYIISFLHRPFAVMIFDFLFFTLYIFIKEKGQIDVARAILRFLAWLRKPGRAQRKPIGPAERAYIRACGGTVWR
jgi:GT2 family glycosyltransferase